VALTLNGRFIETLWNSSSLKVNHYLYECPLKVK
jgi:hypothetical protein